MAQDYILERIKYFKERDQNTLKKQRNTRWKYTIFMSFRYRDTRTQLKPSTFIENRERKKVRKDF